MTFSILNMQAPTVNAPAEVPMSTNDPAARRADPAGHALVPVERWGERLADAARAAIAKGDFAGARRLALEGDGQAHSLAKEYAFMVRGLGITIRVILGLLGETARGPRAGAAAVDALTRLAARFADDLSGDAGAGSPATEALAAAPRSQAGAGASAADPAATLGRALADATRELSQREDRFVREQAQLAQRVVQALDAGDPSSAHAALDAREAGHYLPLHDCLIRFMADSMAWVLTHFGAQELTRFHLATAEGQRAGFDKWESMDAARFAWTSAFLFKLHMGQVAVSEDDEKFTIEQRPCGSGGRLRSGGAYEGAGALPYVEQPGALTFGQPRLPVYCSHCPVWNGVATMRWYGRAHWVFEDPARADGSCTVHIYKRRDATPAAYRAMLEQA